MAEYIEREALIKRIEASPLITNYRILRGSQLLVDGILDLCNGKKGGFKKIIAGFKKKNK